MWESLFEALTDQGYRVLAFDFYGFGYSEALEGSTYNVDLFIEQAEGRLCVCFEATTVKSPSELLHKLHVSSKFTLLGHSMGGLLATLFAVRYCSLNRPLSPEFTVLLCRIVFHPVCIV